MYKRRKRKLIKWHVKFKKYFAPTQVILRVIGEAFQFIAFFIALVVAFCPDCHHAIAILSAFGIVGKTITNSLKLTREEDGPL